MYNSYSSPCPPEVTHPATAGSTSRCLNHSYALPPAPHAPPAPTRPAAAPAAATAEVSTTGKVLEANTINKNIMDMEYAVRGRLVIKAGEYQAELDSGSSSLPFDEIILCNIGNPQSLGQKPLTFYRQASDLLLPHCAAPSRSLPPSLSDDRGGRFLKGPAYAHNQVLAGCMMPELLETGGLPSDVIERSQKILGGSSGMGAYSESKGLPVIRQSVAEFLQRRDGHSADPENIFLTSGASDGIKTIMNMVIRDQSDGILAPIPQYPLYSATTTALGGMLLGYPLDEDNGWTAKVPELRKLCAESRAKGITPRALVVINPGNPTGQLLSSADIAEVLGFCREEGLLMLADEVYQENVYEEGQTFTSFKKVLVETGDTQTELASFHSVSKGLQGECGLRGGYMELVNFSPTAIQTVYKAVSVGLCSNLPGQVSNHPLPCSQPIPHPSLTRS